MDLIVQSLWEHPRGGGFRGHLRSLEEVLVWVGPARTWKPDYSRRWEMNWPFRIKLLVTPLLLCWAHTGLWVASFLGSGSLCHRSPHWKLSPAGHGQLSAVPTMLSLAGWMFGSLSCMLVCIGLAWALTSSSPGLGDQESCIRGGGRESAASAWLCRIYRGCSQDIGRKAWAPHGRLT